MAFNDALYLITDQKPDGLVVAFDYRTLLARI